jgi:hypothetical protein
MTVDTTSDVCASLSCTSNGNYTGTLTFTAAKILTVSGSVTFSTGMTVSGTGTLVLNATGTFTPAGLTFPGALTLAGTSQTYTLGGALSVTGAFTCSGTTLITVATAGNNLTVSGLTTISTSTTFTGAGTVSGAGLTFTTAVTLTIASDWTMTGTFTASSVSGNITLTGAHNLNIGGSLTLGSMTGLSGTATVVLNGTGTWSGGGAGFGVACNLTFNSAGTITVSGSVYFGTGTLTYTAGTITTTSSTLNLTGACTLNTQGMTWNNISGPTGTSVTITLTSNLVASGSFQPMITGTLTFSGAYTVQFGSASLGCTLVIGGDWTITGGLTSSGPLVINGAHNFNVSGNLSSSSTNTLSGTATLVLNGTGTWSWGTGNISINININTSGTITLSGTIPYTTGTITYTAGTVTPGTSTLSIAGSTCTLNTGAMNWYNLAFAAGNSTVTLGSALNMTGTLSATNYSPTFSGAYSLSCGTLTLVAATANVSLTYPAGQTLTVTGAMNVIGTPSYAPTIKSGTASSPAYLAYTGTPANEKVCFAIFTDIDASGSSAGWLDNWFGGTLTRTKAVINRTSADYRREGCWGNGSVAADTIHSISGTCVALTPASTTDPYWWAFLVPTTAATAFALSFYQRISSGFNGSLKVTIYDTDDATKLVNADSVTLTNDGAYHQYTSANVTPTATGFCRVVLTMLKGTAGSAIYVDNVSEAA